MIIAMQQPTMNCVAIEVFAVSINLGFDHPYVHSYVLGWWKAVVDYQMVAAMKTWNRPKYLTRFVTAAGHGHILAVRFTLAIEVSTFWVTELQHMPSTAIRRDFLSVAQSALQHAVRKGPPNLIRLLRDYCINVEARSYRFTRNLPPLTDRTKGGEVT